MAAKGRDSSRRRRPGKRAQGSASAVKAEIRLGNERINFDVRDVLRVYEAGRHDILVNWLVNVLLAFHRNILERLEPADQDFVDRFVETMLYVFTKSDFTLQGPAAHQLVLMSPLIANVVAMSRFRTTDPQVELLMGQERALPKLLALHSARNRVRLDPGKVFDADPRAASIWYAVHFEGARQLANETVYGNLRAHQACPDDRLELAMPETTDPIFHCTYVDAETEPPLKQKLNALIRRELADVAVRNAPQPGRLAVVSGRWSPFTAVYRTYAPFVDALKERYDVTLVLLGSPRDDEDVQGFRDVRRVAFGRDGKLQLREIAENDFQMVVFIDVVMSRVSRYLSNLRLAPIQAKMYGHPVSTWGAQIDYVIASGDVELAEEVGKYYSERVVLIGGAAAFPTIPDYRPADRPRTGQGVGVNCAWNAGKINWPLMQTLRKAMTRTGRKIVFRFFPSTNSLRLNGFIAMRRDLETALGADHVHVQWRTGQEYLQAMEEGDFSIDSYPFGGLNSVIDSLAVGKPVVAWEGTRCYNRYAAELLRRLGLAELVADSEEKYISGICRLAEDDDYRGELSQRVRQTDLKASLAGWPRVDCFVKAVAYLLANHAKLRRDGSRELIVIG